MRPTTCRSEDAETEVGERFFFNKSNSPVQQNLVLFIPVALPELKLSINLIAKCEHTLDSLAHTDGTDLIKGMKFDLQTVYADIPNG